MKLTKEAKWFYLVITICMTLLVLSCEEKDSPTPDDNEIEDIGTLLSQSAQFTHFADLITIADQEIPEGGRGIMDMLTDTESNEQYTIFAPSNEVFESLAQEWSGGDFQLGVAEVIAEFTHSGQPAKTRDFVLGHIFKSTVRFESSAFQTDLVFESEKGISWTMIQSQNANSGFGFVLSQSSSNVNPYLIFETDIILADNGVVHSALVN